MISPHTVMYLLLVDWVHVDRTKNAAVSSMQYVLLNRVDSFVTDQGPYIGHVTIEIVQYHFG